MRQVLAVVVLSLALVAGCTRWNILKSPEVGGKTDLGPTPSVAHLVAYLDENSSRMYTMRCTDLDMTCSLNIQSFGVRGRMLAQKPRNFLMAADVFGGREVDLGSN